MTVVNFQVSQSSDDAASNAGNYYGVQSNSFLGSSSPALTLSNGFRFQGVNIPQGAVVTSATLSLYVEDRRGYTRTIWRSEASDNAATFTESSNRTTGRPDRRITGVNSDIKEVVVDTLTLNAYSYVASVKNAVQEVVNRPGWQTGNALVIIGDDETVGPNYYLTYNTYDRPVAGTYAPKLTIDYYIPSTPTTPDTDWTALGKEDGKTYVYHVTKPDGTFVTASWDVKSLPDYSQSLNTPMTTMSVQIARSPNNRKEERSYLLTAEGDRLVTEAGDPFVVSYQSANNVGPGSDIELNYNVDVYVVYGEFGRLLTANGDYLVTADGDYLVVGTGAPLGRRIFSGFILDYQTEFGTTNGVTVTLASHGYELSQQLALSGSQTTFSLSTTELGAMIKSVLDTNPGRITYDLASIANTAVTRTQKVVLNKKKEVIDNIYQQTPSGWWWYVDPADNLLYLKPKGSVPDHIFTMGKNIKSLKVKQTMEGLSNEVYLVGGETTPGTPSSTLFKRYVDTTSYNAYPRRGLKIITDRLYTSTTNAQTRADKEFSRYRTPIFTSTLVISSSQYDTETIKLGHMVAIRGIDNTPIFLQIVKRRYSPTEVQLDLGELLETQIDTLSGVREQLENDQFNDLPNAPS